MCEGKGSDLVKARAALFYPLGYCVGAVFDCFETQDSMCLIPHDCGM